MSLPVTIDVARLQAVADRNTPDGMTVETDRVLIEVTCGKKITYTSFWPHGLTQEQQENALCERIECVARNRLR